MGFTYVITNPVPFQCTRNTICEVSWTLSCQNLRSLLSYVKHICIFYGLNCANTNWTSLFSGSVPPCNCLSSLVWNECLFLAICWELQQNYKNNNKMAGIYMKYGHFKRIWLEWGNHFLCGKLSCLTVHYCWLIPITCLKAQSSSGQKSVFHLTYVILNSTKSLFVNHFKVNTVGRNTGQQKN